MSSFLPLSFRLFRVQEDHGNLSVSQPRIACKHGRSFDEWLPQQLSLLWRCHFGDSFDLLLFDAHHDLWIIPHIEVPPRMVVSTSVRSSDDIGGTAFDVDE